MFRARRFCSVTLTVVLVVGFLFPTATFSLCESQVKFKIGSRLYYINGRQQKVMDVAPQIKNGKTFIVVKYLSLAAQATLGWDAKEKKATITSINGSTIELCVGKNVAKINGVEKPIDKDPSVTPYLIGGRILAPLRFISQNLGAINDEIIYNPYTKEILISLPDPDCNQEGQLVMGCEWLTYRGNAERTNSIPINYGPKTNNLKLLWTLPITYDDTVSNMSYINGKIYAVKRSGMSYSLSCVDMFKGMIDWSVEADSLIAPTIYKNKIFCGSSSYDLDTGKLIWRLDENLEIDVFSSPACWNNMVYFFIHERTEPPSYSFNIIAFDIETGKQIWEFEISETPYTDLVVSDGKLFFNDLKDGLTCLDAATGKELWTNNVSSRSMYYLSVTDGRVLIYNQRVNIQRLSCFSASDGIFLWESKKGLYTEPAIRGDRIYVGLDKKLVCLNTKNGEKVWESDFGVGMPPILMGDRLYQLSSTTKGFQEMPNTIRCIDAKTGKQVWAADIITPRPVFSNFLLADGRFVLRSYAFGLINAYCYGEPSP